MILSLDYTYLRTGALSERVVEELQKRYPDIYSTLNYIVWDKIPELNKRLAEEFPGKEDLLTEWVLKNYNQGVGWYPDDLDEFINMARFFFIQNKYPQFKEAVRQFSENVGKQFNPKNIMDFNLHNLQMVYQIYEENTEDPWGNKLSKALPPGATRFYSEGAYQIVQVTDTEA